MLLTRLALRARIVTLVILALLIAGGIWSYSRLQVEFLPSVDFPLVTVVTFYPQASPETVLEDVTIPVEDILLEQESVLTVSSTSSLNLSIAFAEFEFGTDVVAIEEAVKEEIARLQLPPTVAAPRVGRLSFEQFPVFQVSIRSGLPPEDLQELAESEVLPRLEQVPGVDSATIPASAGAAGVISRTNGQPSLTIDVVKGPDDNTVEVVDAVQAELERIKADLPVDVQFTEISNQGPEIEDSINKLGREVALGAALAVLVILAFLLSVRPTFVTGISIPASLLIGVIVMHWQGMSLNIVTLGGLAISAGRVVDDSIVVMENIYRHIQDGEDRLHAAFEGTKEVALPITIATLTTIAVFAPLGFIGGIVSEFFLPFALVITYALLASLVVALTAVPVLASLLIRRHGEDTAAEALTRRIVRVYTPMITWALGHRLITVLGAIVLFLGSMSLLAGIPIGFLPSSTQNVLSIEIEAPLPTPPDVVVQYLDDAEARLEQLRLAGDVEAYSSRVGGGGVFQGGAAGLTSINITARLTEETDAEAMAAMLREDFAGPGRTVFIQQAQGGGPPAGDLEVRLISEDYALLQEASDRLIGPISELDGVLNVRSNAIDVSAAGPFAASIPITRVNGQRTVTISGVITAQDTRAVSAEIDRVVAEVGLPPGVERETGGVFSDIQEVFTQMIIAMGIGAVLVYVVMFLAQRSFITPLIILIAVPLAFTGAVIALFITGRALSLPGLMGLLMLIGLVVTNAVVLIAFVDQERARGARIQDALITGGQARIRPILMTALTTSFVLLPLALEEAEGGGGIIGAELATVIIGGLMTSTVLTLVVIPIVYRLLRREPPTATGT